MIVCSLKMFNPFSYDIGADKTFYYLEVISKVAQQCSNLVFLQIVKKLFSMLPIGNFFQFFFAARTGTGLDIFIIKDAES